MPPNLVFCNISIYNPSKVRQDYLSTSRLSIQDDLDDADFSYPFAVDDVDTSDSQIRSADGKETAEFGQPSASSSYKSQNAAVGILVQMLKRAPSLRDQSLSSHSSKSEFKGEGGTSSFFTSKKTSDALRELQSYKEIKDFLLSKSGTQLQESVSQRSEKD